VREDSLFGSYTRSAQTLFAVETGAAENNRIFYPEFSDHSGKIGFLTCTHDQTRRLKRIFCAAMGQHEQNRCVV